ncbi:hypothetical protein [Mycoplasmopsis columbina]|uniref:Uncharacterized protein n=1 Tax=Mycoplasmopsis columbina SF7 TaxID=1037410 RepID=F9UKP1_9BACT|nr:hypothetical protein [Mycoplasmopsis columbina]EGV00246.1 hypothetical protein MCSF7_02271 [Mycoplasmopsis columbina SF7]VEU77135.1 Uncharacterised protein [Mycoplasmopsis columbina]
MTFDTYTFLIISIPLNIMIAISASSIVSFKTGKNITIYWPTIFKHKYKLLLKNKLEIDRNFIDTKKLIFRTVWKNIMKHSIPLWITSIVFFVLHILALYYLKNDREYYKNVVSVSAIYLLIIPAWFFNFWVIFKLKKYNRLLDKFKNEENTELNYKKDLLDKNYSEELVKKYREFARSNHSISYVNLTSKINKKDKINLINITATIFNTKEWRNKEKEIFAFLIQGNLEDYEIDSEFPLSMNDLKNSFELFKYLNY